MNNVLLEVSQRDSPSNVNGDYSVNLKKGVYVYDGDEVAVSKIFIDTESNTDGIINIKNQINCEVDAFLYATNTLENKVLAYGQGGSNDNRDYVLCTTTAPIPVPNNDMVMVVSIIYSPPTKTNGVVLKDWGDPSGALKSFPIMFQYQDIAGFTHVKSVDVPRVDVSTHPENNEYTVYLSGKDRIIMKKNSAVPQVTANYVKNNINPLINQDNKNEADDAGVSLVWRDKDEVPIPVPAFDQITTNPQVFTAYFSIPPNKYLPDDLATLINDELTKNLAQKSVLPGEQVVSTFLKTYSQALTDADTADPLIMVVADDGQQVESTFTMQPQAWVGTDTIQLAFDSTDQKFYWNQLHQSIYDGTEGGGIVSLMVADTGTTPQRYLNISKNGGIVFNNLQSTTETIVNGVITQTEGDFWGNDVLKFDFGEKTSILSPSVGFSEFIEGNDERFGSTATIIDGQHTTNVRLDLNSAIDKKHYQFAQIADFDPIEVSLNQVIKAKAPAVDGQILKSGYFLVEVDCGMRNEIVGTEKITHNINAIASRYYSIGSYTSTELDPSLIYKHRGEPLLLSDIRVRILTPEKQLADVGNDNSIFIEIVRGELSMQIESDN